MVSIHATLAGGDRMPFSTVYAVIVVSIHATLAGGDYSSSDASDFSAVFLSTPPSRVATAVCGTHGTRQTFLSTPPSRVATMENGMSVKASDSFYPRHPRGWRPTAGGWGPE